MKKILIPIFLITFIIFCFSNNGFSTETLPELGTQTHHISDGMGGEASSHEPSPWSILPFAILLGMIASGPLFYEQFWHKNYPKIAVGLALIVITYYVFILENQHSPIHALFEYFQFISLLTVLYVASGAILINVEREGKPMINTVILLIGAVIANIIGTTGASMLLIRPFIRLNRSRIKPYHIVFFIFIVSNVGGSLTPIGDPPLFLGFLKGIPFTWTLTHNFLPWVFAVIVLSAIFYWYDNRNKSVNKHVHNANETYSGKIEIVGKRSFLWLIVAIGAIFLDPNVDGFQWVPAITYHGQNFSFIREFIFLGVAFISYKKGNQAAIRGNEFNFEPIREVAFIFVGIFGTMMPALELVAEFAESEAGRNLINHNTLYWGTGIVSGLLDNAPTYLNFLTAAMAAQGGDIINKTEVVDFANQTGMFTGSIIQLTAISVAAVFFGAMTYIGNGPNFMVKAIAEQTGVQMPSFFGYILRFSLPFLLPVLFIVWLLFFYFA